MNLCTAKITGYFSMPSPALAEHNPSAYSSALASLPPGAGCCAHCGRGILHHVVIRTEDGRTCFIGHDCAEKVGDEAVLRALRLRKTSEELAAIEAERDERRRERQTRRAEGRARTLARWDARRDLIVALVGAEAEAAWREDFESGPAECDGWLCPDTFGSRVSASGFRESMAVALVNGRDFTERMAAATASALEGRRTKRNAAAWDALFESLLPAVA